MQYAIRDTQNERRKRLKRVTCYLLRVTSPKGFTLIELLVVISIIGILIALSLVSYGGAQKQTRDTQRRSDLNQYRNSLENYAAANDGLYTSRTSRQDATSRPCDVLKPNFISDCPDDPGSKTYQYRSNGSGSGAPDATQYVLWVELETGGYWEVCSDGRVGKLTSLPNDAGGNCDVSL